MSEAEKPQLDLDATVPVGTLLLVETGQHDDFHTADPVRVTRAFTKREVSEAFLASPTHVYSDGSASPHQREEDFLPWLVSQGYAEPVVAHRWWVGGYGVFNPVRMDDAAENLREAEMDFHRARKDYDKAAEEHHRFSPEGRSDHGAVTVHSSSSEVNAYGDRLIYTPVSPPRRFCGLLLYENSEGAQKWMDDPDVTRRRRP